MRLSFVAALIALMFGFDRIGWSADPEVGLPDDGWWIRYGTTIKQVGPNGPYEYSATTTVAFVGTEIVDQEKCRWLEIDTVDTFGDKKHAVLRKHLIPEKDLLNAQSLTKDVKRGWIAVNGGDVVQANEDRNKLKQQTALYFITGWSDGEKVDEVKVVDYQHGRLTISHGKKSTHTTSENKTKKDQQIQEKTVTESTGWFDTKTAPLISAMKRSYKLYKNDELVSWRDDEIAIEDSGTDAKTKLPEHN